LDDGVFIRSMATRGHLGGWPRSLSMPFTCLMLPVLVLQFMILMKHQNFIVMYWGWNCRELTRLRIKYQQATISQMEGARQKMPTYNNVALDVPVI
jgi:hypothetical protein